MTDIVERLRSPEVFLSTSGMFSPVAHEAADEIEWLRAGLMRFAQYENECDQTGKPCREPSRCGCYLEGKGWCNDSLNGDPGRI